MPSVTCWPASSPTSPSCRSARWRRCPIALIARQMPTVVYLRDAEFKWYRGDAAHASAPSVHRKFPIQCARSIMRHSTSSRTSSPRWFSRSATAARASRRMSHSSIPSSRKVRRSCWRWSMRGRTFRFSSSRVGRCRGAGERTARTFRRSCAAGRTSRGSPPSPICARFTPGRGFCWRQAVGRGLVPRRHRSAGQRHSRPGVGSRRIAGVGRSRRACSCPMPRRWMNGSVSYRRCGMTRLVCRAQPRCGDACASA